ncbi:tryptophan 2,3-dioxygenase family protein [Streptomyces sp. 6N223]|uniref:tryptophan 2,3-dioxygenase family protein n=1 Tax=Streptomyces sp. 6N223 TaxID=3457412 RepID=UPI003FD0718B
MTEYATRYGTAQAQGRESNDMPYGQVLRLDELLKAARVHDDDPDMVLFLATHQSCEVFFAVILRHLEAARSALDAGDGVLAARRIRPLAAVMATLLRQFDALATLTPDAFNAIRTELGDASGFQSVQWREIEFLCGLRDVRFLNTAGFGDADLARLRGRLEERSLQEAYRSFTAGCQDPLIAEEVRVALLEFDEAVAMWRARHAVLADHFLGRGQGTAGSDGASYLWRAARRQLVPDVWAVGAEEAEPS